MILPLVLRMGGPEPVVPSQKQLHMLENEEIERPEATSVSTLTHVIAVDRNFGVPNGP